MGGILYKGFIIGILISAPMGPIGLLCIQRSLNKGRWHGFATGIGATCSDLLYALITALGMGIIVDFVEDNQGILQIIGGILLVFFGYYIYQTNPSKSLTRPKESANYYQDIVSSFFLTLSNPLIIFLLIALFARFQFIEPNGNRLSLILGFISLACGALFWWFLVSTLVAKVRNNFNVRGLWIMNRIVGLIIILVSVVGIILSSIELSN